MPPENNGQGAGQVFDFIINRLSGTVLRLGEDTIRSGISEAFGDKAGTVVFVDGKDVASSVKTWAAEYGGKGRNIVIGGGDGTVLTAATEILGRDDIALGVLPLGTHNLFARQLGFAADFKKAALQYQNSAPAGVDVGTVNGMKFLCGLMIDKNCVNFYNAREDLRVKSRLPALRKLFNLAVGVFLRRKTTLYVGANDVAASHNITGRVFMVMNNPITPKPVNTPQDNDSKVKAAIENVLGKDGFNDGLLALYSIKGGVFGTAAMLPSVVKGTWTSHKSVSLETATEFSINNLKKFTPVQTTIVLDGEVKQTTWPLEVKLLPNALNVYRPK